MTKHSRGNVIACAVVAAAVMAGVGSMVLLTGCGGGGSDGVPEGASTITGNVVSFSGGSAIFRATENEKGLRGIVAAVVNVLVPSAHASIGGVEVSIAGQTAVTEGDGLFVISGIPPGDYDIIFTFDGQTATMPISIPANATVKLDGVRIVDGQARVSEIEIDVDEDADSDDASDDGVSSDQDSDSADSVDGDSVDSDSTDGDSVES